MGDIYLVRHGQVAFGGDTYDSLSTLGEQQAAAVGAALTRRAVGVERIVVGSMNRHRQTAEIACQEAGWRLPADTDAGWDEFDHVAVLAADGAVDDGDRSLSGPETLRRFFGQAIPRWSSGEHDDEYAETFQDFSARVMQSLRMVSSQLTRDDSVAVVYTSAGVVGWAAAALLAAGEQQWLSLIPVVVNAGITRIRVADRKLELVSYNEHAHLRPELVTFR